MVTARRGVMLVIASPSGAGKTSITRAILDQDDNTTLSVSVTTRQRRSNEIDGRDYHFIPVEAFKRMRAAGELLESAEVHDNFYGTPRAKVEELLSKGRDMIFDIDYQGTLQLYETCRDDMVTVFILPPSIGQLKSRLEHRAQDSAEVIARRLKKARIEMDHWREYDFVLENADLEKSCEKVMDILEGARAARAKPGGLKAYIDEARKNREAERDYTRFVKELQAEIDAI